MKKILGAFAVLTAAGFSQANAAVVYDGATTAFIDTGTFNNLATPSNLGTYTDGVFTFSNASSSASLAQILNTTSSIGAEPLGDSTPYLSVLGGGVVNVTLASTANSLSFFVGSLDAVNSIEFNNDPTNVYTGAQLLGLSDTGCQGDPSCNRFITFSGDITSFTLTSGANSFEVDSFTTAVPEPSTWAMMILGFVGLGFMAYRRKSPSFRFA
jgi:hypothetical protein